jgi:hypothetical protein
LRTIGSLSSRVRVTLFDPVFQDRMTHLKAILAFLPAFRQERCIVFLDPDIGLESRTRAWCTFFVQRLTQFGTA